MRPRAGMNAARPRSRSSTVTDHDYDLFIHGNVGILKTQRRRHADARRPCRRSSSRFPSLTLTLTHTTLLPGFLSNRGSLAEIFTYPV